MNLDEALEEIGEAIEWDGEDVSPETIRSILLRFAASVRDEALEEAAMRAGRCYHGPDDYGCSHGGEIAAEIRALKAGEE